MTTNALSTNTPAGAEFKKREADVIRWSSESWQCDAIVPLNPACGVDVIYHRDGKVGAVAEVKCRDRTLEKIRDFPTYMIEEGKLGVGIAFGQELGVPFYLIVQLSDGNVLTWHISDKSGNGLVRWKTGLREVPATYEGGRTTKQMAYLPLEKAKCQHVPEFITNPGMEQ